MTACPIGRPVAWSNHPRHTCSEPTGLRSAAPTVRRTTLRNLSSAGPALDCSRSVTQRQLASRLRHVGGGVADIECSGVERPFALPNICSPTPFTSSLQAPNGVMSKGGQP